MSIILYTSVAHCDTVKKARKWLDAQGLTYTFHDFKKDGPDPEKLESWVADAGWEKVLNRASTTFRNLSEDQKTGIDAVKAIEIMIANPSAIKRPVVEYPGGLLVGFKEADWHAALSA